MLVCVVLAFLTSCSNNEKGINENETLLEVRDEGLIANKYVYKSNVYSLQELKTTHPVVFDMASMSYDFYEDTMYVFDNSKDYDVYTQSNNLESQIASRGGADCWGFKFRIWEHENYRGRYFEFKRSNIPRSKDRAWTNMPSWMNDKGSLIVLDEIDFSFSGGNAASSNSIVCYEDYNRTGRRIASAKVPLFPWDYFTRNNKFSHLRKNNWNDTISSIEIIGS